MRGQLILVVRDPACDSLEAFVELLGTPFGGFIRDLCGLPDSEHQLFIGAEPPIFKIHLLLEEADDDP